MWPAVFVRKFAWNNFIGAIMIKIFEVGGSIRDKFLNTTNKDRDFAIEASSWEEMRSFVHMNSSKVFLESPEFFTIRSLFIINNKPEVRDFVLCRKDGAYTDGRHPEQVMVGTIIDDLSRRDFTVNAMAIEESTGILIDPFNGKLDCENKILKCVGKTEDRFNEDSLRMIRAIRFIITKNLIPSVDIQNVLQDSSWANKLSGISTERIREELFKCFKHDSLKTIRFLSSINSHIAEAIFDNNIWLEPTTKSR